MRNVPKLRFKEFSEEWEEKKLGEVLKIGNGKDYKNLEQGEIPVYGTGGLITKVNDYLYNGESVGIGRKGTINKPMFLTGKFWTVDTLFYTYDFNNSIPKFIYYIFNNIDWLSYNEATGVPSLSKSTILKIKSFVPDLQEQQKIADFLSSVDKKISITEEKLDLFKKYKKGIMQKIFNQELRFKDSNNNDYPEWEEKRLGDISSISAGGDIKKENFSENKTGEFKIPIYANSLEKNGLYGYSNIFKVEGESITVTARGNIGVATYRNENYVPIVRLLVIKMDSAKYSHKYFSYFINTIKIIQEVTGVPQLTAPQLREYKAIYPISLEEQEKIANFLSSIDNKIDNLAAELEDLKEFKKGLLQQMFV